MAPRRWSIASEEEVVAGVDAESPVALALRDVQRFDQMHSSGADREVLLRVMDALGRALNLACTGVREPGEVLAYDHSGDTCPIHEWLVPSDAL